jgi:uncharacterized protein (TIGR02246 family)
MMSDTDRLAIEAVLKTYGWAIDERDFDMLASLFTDDASVIYGGYPERVGGTDTANWLESHTQGVAWCQHLVTVMDVRFDSDDRASTLSYFVAHAVGADDSDTVRMHVGEYRDRLLRTPDGWRICERRQHTGWKETRTRTEGLR